MRVSQIGSTSQNIPGTYPREQPVCGRCSRCHPGKQWGGDEACRAYTCTCHRKDAS